MSAAAAAPRIVGVKRLADYLKRKVESDAQLRGIAVRGEVTNFSLAKSGSANFDLKEGDAIVKCFAFPSDAVRFPALRNGLAVIAKGSVSLYAPKSTFQLVVNALELDGIGDVHALFEARKERLTVEGLFDAARKRPLPRFPFRVALVSSRAANGAIDFTTILRERASHVAVVWCETAVQGPNAPAEIVAALGRASRADVDAIVVTRGGGSFEDLFAFSDEHVVRAIARARHPVISAIGHAADRQLSDFAADRHVETPSAAAEALGTETRELRHGIFEAVRRSRRTLDHVVARLVTRLDAALIRSKLTDARIFLAPARQRLDDAGARLAAAREIRERACRDRLSALERRLDRHEPSRALGERTLRVRALGGRLDATLRAKLERGERRTAAAGARLDPALRLRRERLQQRVALAVAHLDGKNPETILQRGYAIVSYGTRIVRDVADVPGGAVVEARLARGTLSARVERKTINGD